MAWTGPPFTIPEVGILSITRYGSASFNNLGYYVLNGGVPVYIGSVQDPMTTYKVPVRGGDVIDFYVNDNDTGLIVYDTHIYVVGGTSASTWNNSSTGSFSFHLGYDDSFSSDFGWFNYQIDVAFTAQTDWVIGAVQF